jgi:hypothetical protein
MAIITVTGNQILEALSALRYILGINDEKDGNNKARFSFKPKHKILLAKKLKQLSTEGDALNDHKKELMQELGISGAMDTDGKNVEGPAVVAAFSKRWSEFLDAEQELEIGMIEESALELGTEEAPKNDIAGGFLAALDWLIVWADAKPAEPAKT